MSRRRSTPVSRRADSVVLRPALEIQYKRAPVYEKLGARATIVEPRLGEESLWVPLAMDDGCYNCRKKDLVCYVPNLMELEKAAKPVRKKRKDAGTKRLKQKQVGGGSEVARELFDRHGRVAVDSELDADSWHPQGGGEGRESYDNGQERQIEDEGSDNEDTEEEGDQMNQSTTDVKPERGQRCLKCVARKTRCRFDHPFKGILELSRIGIELCNLSEEIGLDGSSALTELLLEIGEETQGIVNRLQGSQTQSEEEHAG
ncbi:hypothetical protein BCR39DRAFT_553177 [Naematelia encephala]|uniref:Uncharacterized protein n=1 Tax=Naematelia encephala TaxID=71784 RepID=A0A1Y2AGJ1_9TREE|nr:hypothetical protein BCR39DRAFT_553177 [Naematelia encephala]